MQMKRRAPSISDLTDFRYYPFVGRMLTCSGLTEAATEPKGTDTPEGIARNRATTSVLTRVGYTWT